MGFQESCVRRGRPVSPRSQSRSGVGWSFMHHLGGGLLLMLAVALAHHSAADGSKWSGPRTALSPEVLQGLSSGEMALLRVPDAPYWLPSHADIEAAEQLLSPRLPIDARAYGRQYLGFSSGGKRLVQVRGFCSLYSHALPVIPVSLLDAGVCVFHADIDPKGRQVLRLEWGSPGPG